MRLLDGHTDAAAEASRLAAELRRRPKAIAQQWEKAWRDQAACRNVTDPEIFFPVVPGTADGARALTYCHRCPVTGQCLKSARAFGDWGIRGGIWIPPPDSRYAKADRDAQRAAVA